MKIGKHCTDCARWYPLFMFKTDTRKFQLKIALGKVRVCRICTFVKSGKGSVTRWNGKDFQNVTLTFKERIKEFFTK